MCVILQEKWELPCPWKLQPAGWRCQPSASQSALNCGEGEARLACCQMGLPVRSCCTELRASPTAAAPSPSLPSLFSFYPIALLSWALKRLLLSHRYSMLLLVFKISTYICCLFTTLSSNLITLVWSYLIPSGKVTSYPIPFFSLFSVLIIPLISFACWLLIFSCARSSSCGGFSLYGPIFKSIPQKLISFM